MSFRVSVHQIDGNNENQVFQQTVDSLNLTALVMVVNGLAKVPRVGFKESQDLEAAGPVPPRDPPIDPEGQ